MYSISGKSPAAGSSLNALDSLIEFTVTDSNESLELSSVSIRVNGDYAVKKGVTQSLYNGASTEVTLTGGKTLTIKLHRTTDYELGAIVTVDIYIEDSAGNFNKNYTFKTIPKEPILYESNIINGTVITSPKVLYLQFLDEVDGVEKTTLLVHINDKKIIEDGVFITEFSGYNSAVTDVLNGVSVIIEHPEFFRNGNYDLRYQIADTNGHLLYGKIKFSVKLDKVIYPDLFPNYSFIGFVHGIEAARNYGDGDKLQIEWHKTISRINKAEIFPLIYKNSKRLEVFDDLPQYIAKQGITSFELTGNTTGESLSFGVRALEAYKDIFDLTGMTEADTDVYIVPVATKLTSGLPDSGYIISVASVSGYPDKGLLIINSKEVVKYTSVDRVNNAFNVPDDGRGLNETAIGVFAIDDEVKLFLKCQDSNSNIISATPVYIDGIESGRTSDGVGVVVTDYEDVNKKFFQGFDYCGYHQALPTQTLQGELSDKDCGSYLGGEFNGQRGMYLFDRMLNREEMLLEQVGEKTILLQRIWDGTTCDCLEIRSVHPKIKTCNKCYGTGYIGGYTQYLNKRRVDRKTLIRFKEAAEDLNLGAHQHLNVMHEPGAWTLPMPTIRDRDMIVRFDFTGDLEYIYEVLDANREKVVFTHYGRQNLRLKRKDKTDIIYTFPYT